MKQMLPAHCPPQALHVRDTENKSKSVGVLGTRGTSEGSGDIDLGSCSVLGEEDGASDPSAQRTGGAGSTALRT